MMKKSIEEAESTSSEPTGGRRRHHHRVRIVLLAAATIVLLAFAYPTVRYTLRSHPKAKSISSAIKQFRDKTSIPQSASNSFLRPAAGVYRAVGQGGEKIAFPPNSQSDGAVLPITVRDLANGCWNWRIDYNTAHWHEYTFCPKDAQLLLVSQQNFQSWDFGMTHITNLGEFTCTPARPIVEQQPQAGKTYMHYCTGKNSAVAGASITDGPATFVGVTTLNIGGTPVRAIHQDRVQSLSGSQRGEIHEDWWFATDTGLPLRAERHYTVTSDSPLGTINYTENGSWQLSSIRPEQ